MSAGATAHHDLFVFDTDERLGEHGAPFVEGGLDAGESIVVVLDASHTNVLRDALGARSDAVTFIDREGFYTTPEAALAGYDGVLRRLRAGGAPGVRCFGELPRIATRRDYDRWIAYDAILNRAMARHQVWIRCAYDARDVPPDVIAEARSAHPHELLGDSRSSIHGPAPEDVVRAMTPAPEPLPELAPIAAGDAVALRRLLREALGAAGVSDDPASQLLLAAAEVVANARRHGRGAVTVRAGRVGRRFACEIADEGAGVTDPMAGFVPPAPDDGQGAGLWVARQLTEQLEVLHTPGGSAVRLWV
ncbi:MAG: hypothetical protein QOF86_2922 [Baekduia sp.]|jgi:anti-sigma regulatory factor (Ser/Thr protein kinase)|nr:hypothetical protein [Baekduia sp.]